VALIHGKPSAPSLSVNVAVHPTEIAPATLELTTSARAGDGAALSRLGLNAFLAMLAAVIESGPTSTATQPEPASPAKQPGKDKDAVKPFHPTPDPVPLLQSIQPAIFVPAASPVFLPDATAREPKGPYSPIDATARTSPNSIQYTDVDASVVAPVPAMRERELVAFGLHLSTKTDGQPHSSQTPALQPTPGFAKTPSASWGEAAPPDLPHEGGTPITTRNFRGLADPESIALPALPQPISAEFAPSLEPSALDTSGIGETAAPSRQSGLDLAPAIFTGAAVPSASPINQSLPSNEASGQASLAGMSRAVPSEVRTHVAPTLFRPATQRTARDPWRILTKDFNPSLERYDSVLDTQGPDPQDEVVEESRGVVAVASKPPNDLPASARFAAFQAQSGEAQGISQGAQPARTANSVTEGQPRQLSNTAERIKPQQTVTTPAWDAETPQKSRDSKSSADNSEPAPRFSKDESTRPLMPTAPLTGEPAKARASEGEAQETEAAPTKDVNSDIRPSTTGQTAVTRQISLKLPGADAANVSVQFRERAGRIEVAVRTPDTEVARSLQTDLGDLVSRLENRGYKTEAWIPGAADHHAISAHRSSDTTSNQQPQEHAGSGQQNHSHGDPHQRRHQRQGREFNEMITEADGRREL